MAKKSLIAKMEEYGYGNIQVSDERVALVDTCNFHSPFPEDIFEVFAE